MEIRMQSLSFRITCLAGAAVLAGMWAGQLRAEALAQLPALNHVGEQMLASQGMTASDLQQRIPSRESVGMPVYPGALYTGEILGEGMMPSVVLATSDPIETVKEWYSGQEGLRWEDSFGLFFRGTDYVLMESESVLLMNISAHPASSAGGLMFDMSGMQTQITISYQPKTGINDE
jgi:hypothetical protein